MSQASELILRIGYASRVEKRWKGTKKSNVKMLFKKLYLFLREPENEDFFVKCGPAKMGSNQINSNPKQRGRHQTVPQVDCSSVCLVSPGSTLLHVLATQRGKLCQASLPNPEPCCLKIG